MKRYNALILVTLLSGNLAAQEINSNTFNTADEYPYKFLTRVTDKIEIHYEDKGEQGFTCSTSIHDDGAMIVTPTLHVSRGDFVKDALKACLVRDEAKQLLSAAFNGELTAKALHAKN